MKVEQAQVNANRETRLKEARSEPAETGADGFVYVSENAGPLTARQIGLVPGAEAPLLPVSLPPALQGYAREQVAQRQLGDRLGLSAQAFDMRPFPASAKSRMWSRAIVTDPKKLSRWRALAGSSGRAVLPDYLALPAAQDIWVLRVAGEMVMARLGPEDGFSASPAIAARLLRQALDAAGAPPKALFAMTPLPNEIDALFSERDLPVAGRAAELEALGLAPPRSLAHGELTCDLRLDPRAARSRLASRILPWRWPVLAGLIAVGFWSAAQLLAIEEMRQETVQVRASTLGVVRDAFVPTGPILDIRTQVSRSLAEARVAASGGEDRAALLDLLGLVSDVLVAHEARPLVLDYESGNTLRAEVQVADFSASEALAEALRDAGLDVRVVEARAEGGSEGVRADLEISARAASEPPERARP
ncbi:type II secretion system protein GspL [Roseovarius aestuariivivens]|uniref:type II secretion system protein GspL n=1 Tax=Roseovarius aestuariivivens TaxID=1888910 RepID=UPI0010808080|nr:type II secretion system protein GspL [Roseovarius aestuariivivens]